MRNKIIVLLGVALVAYVLGSRASKYEVRNGETVPHQVVRLWSDPKAQKARRKSAAKAAKKYKKVARELKKQLA